MKILNTFFNKLIFDKNFIYKKINFFEANFLTKKEKIFLQYQFLNNQKIIDFFINFKNNTITLLNQKDFDNFDFHKLSLKEQKNILTQIAAIIKKYQSIKKKQDNESLFDEWNDDFILENIVFDQKWIQEMKETFLLVRKSVLKKKKNVLSHCDLHINNFLINNKKKVILIDFDTCHWSFKLFDLASFIEETKLNLWQINYFCDLFSVKKKTIIGQVVLYHSLFWFFWSYYYYQKTFNLKFFDLCLYHLQNYCYFKLIFPFSSWKSSSRK
ncbi:phosphotransferase [symbiont of Argiope bruennichi]|uniref:phosphotransferase n=1 Tax=symbiont of Argiope bruennichi TaxID=2810479 RepID=UPI003DA3271E